MDNPLSECGISNDEWENKITYFLYEQEYEEKIHKIKSHLIPPTFINKLIDTFENLSECEKKAWKIQRKKILM
jgi:hypothetical protein